ncbi:hypothetical protein LVISKB_0035 [Levilactobacillus brevis KB290]|uniref:Uncharacterized protein n=1 Tax=Levilactobacillus brevis KB290 TaxID=1001583 RepID=M5ABC4_LEVBR|nr:hypothetical protein LVISKB_0035 [Levilactobacillus brevis KB290]
MKKTDFYSIFFAFYDLDAVENVPLVKRASFKWSSGNS